MCAEVGIYANEVIGLFGQILHRRQNVPSQMRFMEYVFVWMKSIDKRYADILTKWEEKYGIFGQEKKGGDGKEEEDDEEDGLFN